MIGVATSKAFLTDAVDHLVMDASRGGLKSFNTVLNSKHCRDTTHRPPVPREENLYLYFNSYPGTGIPG